MDIRLCRISRLGVLASGLLLTVCLTGSSSLAYGQKPDADTEEIPSPEAVTLETRDGITIKGTFYGSNLGKEAVPVMIVHDFKENRNEYDELASTLQANGHAVLTIDLRGHGESIRGRRPNDLRERVFGVKDLRKYDMRSMYGVDGELEAAKRFLIEKNNASELNINKLCIIGTGFGGIVALNWAMLDWSWPVLTTGKQGQDVRAVVLISPLWSFQGLHVREALNHPLLRTQVSMLILTNTGKQAAAAKQIHNALKNFHPEPAPEDIEEKKDLFLRQLDTSVSGSKMLDKALDVPKLIEAFIDLRLSRKDFPWSERHTP